MPYNSEVVYDSEEFFDKIFLPYKKCLIKFKQFNVRTKDGREILYADLVQAINIMIKKHPYCRWQGKSIRTKRSFVLNEGYLWLMFVYFQNEKKRIDADIDFFKDRISEYERVLKKENVLEINHKKIFWDKSMTVKELSEYFERDISAVRKGIGKMCNEGLSYCKHYIDKKVVVDDWGIEWLCKYVFKHKYLELLELYKMELTEKYIRANYYYDNYF